MRTDVIAARSFMASPVSSTDQRFDIESPADIHSAPPECFKHASSPFTKAAGCPDLVRALIVAYERRPAHPVASGFVIGRCQWTSPTRARDALRRLGGLKWLIRLR
jgi:hypothetical protein